MSSKIVNAHTTAESVFTAANNKVERIRGIQVDHRGIAAVQLTLQDSFTTTATVAAAAAAVVENRKIWSVMPGANYTWMDDERSIKILGECLVDSDVIDADVEITILW